MIKKTDSYYYVEALKITQKRKIVLLITEEGSTNTMFAKARRMRDGSWIVGYPVICQKIITLFQKMQRK